MSPAVLIMTGGMLFLVGLRLSAFFSGSETGFYRVSLIRLSIDADEGDPISQRLMWFRKNPSQFVSTTLIGNNIANYLTTWALGLIAVAFGWYGKMEIMLTLLATPLVFIAGELIPKSLYLSAPRYYLKKDFRFFWYVYLMLKPLSLPLVWFARFLERLGRNEEKKFELALGRNRLVQLMGQGHQTGLLLDVQNRVVNGLFKLARKSILDSMIPTARITGLSENATSQQIIEYARKQSVANVLIQKKEGENNWFGYIRISDLVIRSQHPTSLIKEAVDIPVESTYLETMCALLNANRQIGIVKDEKKNVLGIVTLDELSYQLHHHAAET